MNRGELDALGAGGVDIIDAPVRRIVTGADGHVAAVELADDARIGADVVVVSPRSASAPNRSYRSVSS